MNIYALKGHKVICKTLSSGIDSDKQIAEKYLEIGKEYTVAKTKVYNWTTVVYLQEFPNIKFNSIFFKDAIKQSSKNDKKHKDYFLYH